jgi:hypothetical protein
LKRNNNLNLKRYEKSNEWANGTTNGKETCKEKESHDEKETYINSCKVSANKDDASSTGTNATGSSTAISTSTAFYEKGWKNEEEKMS